MSSPAPSPPTDQHLQARLAHLAAIQTIVGRLAGYSSTIKTLSITLAAALVALAFDQGSQPIAYAAIVAGVAFMLLDAYYLALEKSFRDLYADVAKRPWDAAFNLLLSHTRPSLRQVLAAALTISVSGLHFPVILGLGVASQVVARPDLRTTPKPAVSPAASDTTGPSKPVDGPPRPAAETKQGG